MIHAPTCPYRDFDAAKHAKECGECDQKDLESRCDCRRTTSLPPSTGLPAAHRSSRSGRSGLADR